MQDLQSAGSFRYQLIIKSIIMKSQDQEQPQLQILLNCIREIDHSLNQQEIPNRVILLMGNTKAGKTTLFYFLEGKKLIWEKNEFGVWQLRPQTNYMNAYIGSGYESTTVYPNIPPFESEDNVMVIDMPGFDDSRLHYRLLNIHILLQTLKNIKSVHVCHVISEENCEGNGLVEEFTKIINLFNKSLILSENSLSFIFTKVENQYIKETFLAQVSDLIESNSIEGRQEELQAFKKKNVFQFNNKEVQIEEGLQLRKRIEMQSDFYEMNGKPQQILSNAYSEQMIGRSYMSDFSNYILQVIASIRQIMQPCLHLLFNVLILQLQIPLLSSMQEIQQAKEAIKYNSSIVKLYGINQARLQAKQPASPSKIHYLALLKSFKHLTKLERDKQLILIVFQSFSNLIQEIFKHSVLFEEDQLNNLCSSVKGIGMLVRTIMEVHLSQVRQQLLSVLMSQGLLRVIDNYREYLLGKKNSALSSSQFKRHINDEEIISLMMELDVSEDAQQEYIIEKVHRYTIPLAYQTITKNKTKQKILMYTKKNEIKSLQRGFLSLKDVLFDSKQRGQILTLLNNMFQIFYQSSFLEQAIMFKMVLMDENSIKELIEEGSTFQSVSKQFMRAILIPYYTKVNCDISQLQVIYNYLSSLAISIDQKRQIEVQRIQSIESILQAPQNYCLMEDRYKVLEFYYIECILQNLEYYQERIQLTYQSFHASPLNKLGSFINNKMKQ